GDQADAAAAPQREGGSRGERRQELEILVGRAAVLEIELERSHRGLPQRESGRPPAVSRLNLHGGDDAARSLPESRERVLDRLATRRAPAEAESREERRRCVGLDAPQSGRLSAGGFGCEPNDVLRRFGFVRACGERLAEELERSALAFSP